MNEIQRIVSPWHLGQSFTPQTTPFRIYPLLEVQRMTYSSRTLTNPHFRGFPVVNSLVLRMLTMDPNFICQLSKSRTTLRIDTDFWHPKVRDYLGSTNKDDFSEGQLITSFLSKHCLRDEQSGGSPYAHFIL